MNLKRPIMCILTRSMNEFDTDYENESQIMLLKLGNTFEISSPIAHNA